MTSLTLTSDQINQLVNSLNNSIIYKSIVSDMNEEDQGGACIDVSFEKELLEQLK